MKTISAPSSATRNGRLLSAFLAVATLLSGLMHILFGVMFLLVISIGDGPRDISEPYVSPYTATEFFILVAVLLLAALVLLGATYATFVSLRSTVILAALALVLDLGFIVGEAASVDRGEPILLELSDGSVGVLILLAIWIGPPLVIAGLAAWARYEGLTVARGALLGTGTSAQEPSKRLALAMMIGILFAFTLGPIEMLLGSPMLMLIAVGIPLFPRRAHLITYLFVLIAGMRLLTVVTEGEFDSLPLAAISFLLTLAMLRLVLRGQRNLGIHGHTEPGLGPG